MGSRALVTGGAGLIGSHIVDLLLEDGFKVRILDNLEETTHPRGKPAWIPNEAEFIQGDVRDVSMLERTLQGIDVVFHQAAFGGFVPEISKYVDVNAVGTAKIYETIAKNHVNIEKIIVASSQAVYGEGKYRCVEHGIQYPDIRGYEQLSKGEWEISCPYCGLDLTPCSTDEDKPLNPTKIYAMSKFAEEQIALNLGKELGIPTVCLRYSLTYGPRQSVFNPYTGVCSIFSTRLLNGLPVVVYEDGQQIRDFVFVKDVAKANILAMKNKDADDRVFNVGSGKNESILEFIDVLGKAYSIEPQIVRRGEYRPGEVRHLYADIGRISLLGYQPTYSIEAGIRYYTEWIQSQDDIEDYFTQAEVNMRRMGIIRKVGDRQ